MTRPRTTTFRVGHGYDLHRLEPVAPAGKGRPFRLAGVAFNFERGPVGHSDGDAALHALTDAILGGLGWDDLGSLFPDDDPRHDNADSALFLRAAVRLMREHGYELGNADITVICEEPKISPRKSELIDSLSALLECDPAQVNIKGKTHEKVDAVGEGRAIEVHAVVLLVPMVKPRPADGATTA